MSDLITQSDLRAFADLCAEAYRLLWNIPDAEEVDVNYSAHVNGTVQITLKRVKDDNAFTCPDCSEQFAGPRYLSAHIIREHR